MTLVRELEVLARHRCYRMLEEDQVRVGRVAIAGPRPVIFPINYALDGEDIIFRTAQGTKFAAAVTDTYVAFEVDQIHPGWNGGWSVLVRGRSHLVTDPAETERLSQLSLQTWVNGDRPHFVRITAEQISGRRLT